jgi:DNA-binding transcriptional LysR family regulator
MPGYQRVLQLWNWLPTFWAAAEAQHWGAAGQRLGISTSAVSRTIRLLEEAVGAPLFERAGRNVRLNLRGQRFLAQVRDALSAVSTGLDALDDPHADLRIATETPLSSGLLLPALHGLEQRRLLVSQLDQRVATSALANAEVDLLLGLSPLQRTDVSSCFLGQLCFSRYAARGARVRAPAWAALWGWHERNEPAPSLVLPDIDGLVRAACSGRYQVELPDPLAATFAHWLERLPGEPTQRTALFASRRVRRSVESEAPDLIDIVTYRLQSWLTPANPLRGRLSSNGEPLLVAEPGPLV